MTRSDLIRRGATVLALVACLLSVAAMAQAKFSATSSRGLAVGTATMVAPTGATGSYTCRIGFLTEGITFTIGSFTDNGPGRTSYRFRVSSGSTVQGSTSSTTTSGAVSSAMVGVDVGATTWTLSIQTELSNWTSPVWTKSVTCPFHGTATGTF
ncbi:hypothetical protein [Nocardioides jensenii]|uniref:hypothetical protein n=1 Tax=Nocardioides jensenii TaxID=1843 RepID=UPI00082A2282|nr:hypothetical protein [Nocardioides jensenii]